MHSLHSMISIAAHINTSHVRMHKLLHMCWHTCTLSFVRFMFAPHIGPVSAPRRPLRSFFPVKSPTAPPLLAPMADFPHMVQIHMENHEDVARTAVARFPYRVDSPTVREFLAAIGK